MSRFLSAFLLLLSFTAFSQEKNYNLSGKYAAEGYDVVAYFDGKSKKGSSRYETEFDGVKFKFSSAENLAAFKKGAQKYVPQYGGWCAYAMGTSGDKVSVDPETFEIRDGKLYLFYNAFFTNTLEKWTEEGPEQLRKKADENWQKKKS